MKGLERKISETRAQLDAKMVENEKVLAEISISANGQVNQANEKESHLLSEIASFLGTTVEAVAEEDFGKFFYSKIDLTNFQRHYWKSVRTTLPMSKPTM